MRSLEFTSGDLLSRLVSDIETLQDFFVRVLAPPLVAALIGIFMWFILGAFQSAFALVFLVFYLLAGVGIPLVMYLMGRTLEERIVLIRASSRWHLSIRSREELTCSLMGEQVSKQRMCRYSRPD